MKICLPLRRMSQKEVLVAFEEAQDKVDMFEVWLDSIHDLDIYQLVEACPLPLLCVCKGEIEHGDFSGSEKDRINILIIAAKAGADMIDIGIHTDTPLIRKFLENKGDSKLILSFHNWDKTPKLTSMLSRVDEMLPFQPDYVKYVSTAEDIKDNIQIFRLADNLKKKNVKFVAMCMGEQGKLSRIAVPFLGGEWMYAPLDIQKSSAPGQIDAETLRKLWGELS